MATARGGYAPLLPLILIPSWCDRAPLGIKCQHPPLYCAVLCWFAHQVISQVPPAAHTGPVLDGPRSSQ
eukprot:CAMPEP_0202888248 /NCGR_PEP_ID=MMETSP1391-20130828/43095_1 /ASSEMBLY_ACC=CAM_ASM_000867 /TAXON_ID=1034604 /ORGANISM="Chlamydomonas leiostraca, Strain SAG 11-49" /LENGTH=68 /DNA_ID=CAMNT_0049571549 /DNA_START=821 /DNA_END=1024 /DNA_ORIENTATION=+